MQVGELEQRVIAQKVGEKILPRIPGAAVRTKAIKEEEKPTAQNIIKEQIQKNLAPQKQDDSQDLKPSELNKTIEELNKHFQIFNTRLSFSFNDESDTAVIKIQDRNSGEVIKQIPPQEMLDSLAKISNIVGLLIDKMM